MHTAARFGVPELVALLLTHGASVNALNALQETPLMTAAFWAFDSKEQVYSQDHHFVCRLLLDHQAGDGLWIYFKAVMCENLFSPLFFLLKTLSFCCRPQLEGRG